MDAIVDDRLAGGVLLADEWLDPNFMSVLFVFESR
jgi:hypothetical protein